MLTEMVGSVETLVGFLNPKQFLFVSTQGIEDGLTVGLSVDEEVSAKLRHHCGNLDVLRVRQRSFLIEAKARQLAETFVQSVRCVLWIEVQIFCATLDEGLAGNDIEQDRSANMSELLWPFRHGDNGRVAPHAFLSFADPLSCIEFHIEPALRVAHYLC